MTERKLDQETLCEKLNQGKTNQEIAESYDVAKATVSVLRSEYGIKTRDKLSDVGSGSRTAVIKEHELEEAGFDPHTELYYDKEVRDGEIAIFPTEKRVAESGEKQSD